MSFHNRLAVAAMHEQNVMARIREYGWACDPFGQALFTPAVRDAMRSWPTLVRWSPDLIAVWPRRIDTATPNEAVRLIDAKWSERQDTPFYDVEVDSLLAHQRWIGAFDHGVWLVFHDFRCCRVDDVLMSDRIADGWWNGRGSGTPFKLIPRDEPYIHDLGDKFGITKRATA